MAGVDDELGGDGYITNIHITDLHIEGPVPEQTCIFKYLKELDLDGTVLPCWSLHVLFLLQMQSDTAS